MPGMSKKELCFFCEEKSPTEALRSASTFGLDSRVRSAALLLEDDKLLTKLNSGDLIAVEANYHKKCLTSLYNHARDKKRRQSRQCDDLEMAHSLALAELISYLEGSRTKGEIKVHKLSSLVKDYSVRLAQLGVDSDQQVHATRLKHKLTTHIPGLHAIPNGREVLLSLDEDIGDLLSDSLFQDHDSDAMCLMRAANIVRRDILDHQYCFQGSFEPDCQSKSVPESLNALVRMILEGSSIKNQASISARESNQATLTIAQLIKFNCVKSRKQNSSFVRHQNSMETPLPLYIGAMLHTRTRKKGLLDKLFDLGISVSYDRVLNVSADLGNLLSDHFEALGIVCPSSLRKNVFTTMAVDNIDHNPSSATASDSFHGTAISVVQHPSAVGEGAELEKPPFISTARKSIKPLPSFYSNVSPVAKSSVESPTKMLQGSMAFDSTTMAAATQDEFAWLEQLHDARKEEEMSDSEIFKEVRMRPWPVFHSQRNEVQVRPKSSSCLLPMFPDCAHSVPMIKHSMKMAVKLTDYVNPGQTPVLVCDQPLFAIAKQIQWTWPKELGEEYFMVMMGGLHVEMALLATLGNFLDNSGWIEALVLAQVTTSGRAQSLLTGSKVKRTRYAHLVTLGVLNLLQQDSYAKYLTSVEGTEPLEFLDWCYYRASMSPQFNYWNTVIS